MIETLHRWASDPSIFLTGVLGLGALAQWIAWRFRLPSILLLLAFGFGARILTGVDPVDVLGEDLLFAFISLFVAVILFEGGLSLKLFEVREFKSVVARLVTIGVLVTWILAMFAGCVFMGMHWKIAALIGAILTVTGPTVVGPLLRHIRPSRNVASITKWEGIVVDPIGALFAVLIFEALFEVGAHTGHAEQASSTSMVAMILVKTLVIGVSIACATAYALIQALKRFLIPDYLHNFVFLVVAIASFTISNQLQHESGLVTVTLLGILLANQSIFPVKHVLEFKENLRDLLISTLFIALSARIEMDQIIGLGWGGVAFVVMLILVIRPLAVFASCIGSTLSLQERAFLAFLAPRGIVAAAVSSVFALEVMHNADNRLLPGAEQIVPITFLVIVGTVLTYGLLSPIVARLLGLATPNPQGLLFTGATRWVREIAKSVHEEGFRVLMIDTNFQNVSAARVEGIPAVCASVLSEFVDEEVELGGIGRMLAMTPNDDLNRLASLEFSHDLGRANVFQLSPNRNAASERRKTSTAHIEGRSLFHADAHFAQLDTRFENGAIIKKTRLSAEFTYQDFVDRYQDQFTVLFVITENNELIVSSSEQLTPKPGQMVIALIDDEAKD